ncbi:MAG: hypothetical protein AVDCRST_MAG62-1993, partial [uncultured Sphingomonas sp.]
EYASQYHSTYQDLETAALQVCAARSPRIGLRSGRLRRRSRGSRL